MTKKAKAQTIIISLVTVLLLILIFQNTEPVETKVLFGSFTLPRFVLLLITFAVGAGAGYSLSSYIKGKRKG